MKKHLVDFIIAGAPKCGTTALAAFLDMHPEVAISRMKEPRFFTRIPGDLEGKLTGNGPRLSGNYDKGLDWYNRLWEDDLHHQKLRGEASTLYFVNADAPQLIKEHNPEIKLIMMLRHPVDRLYSHYWQEHKLGYDFPSFQEMAMFNHARFQFYSSVSHYKANIERYFQLFSPEQILILDQQIFQSNTKEECKRVCDFLGIPFESMAAVDFSQRFNEQEAPANRSVQKALTKAQSSTLGKLIPTGMRKSLGKVRAKLVRMNSGKFDYPPLPDDLRAELNHRFSEDIAFYHDILKKDR